MKSCLARFVGKCFMFVIMELITMLEDDVVSCPVCDKELHVKVIMRKKPVYIVSDDCPNCKTPANKIENMLNRSNKQSYIKVEKSYLKLGMKDKGNRKEGKIA